MLHLRIFCFATTTPTLIDPDCPQAGYQFPPMTFHELGPITSSSEIFNPQIDPSAFIALGLPKDEENVYHGSSYRDLPLDTEMITEDLPLYEDDDHLHYPYEQLLPDLTWD
jgi:hypothetical protein